MPDLAILGANPSPAKPVATLRSTPASRQKIRHS